MPDDNSEDDRLAALFPNLAAILRYARDQDCRWLNLDADGEIVHSLATFAW